MDDFSDSSDNAVMIRELASQHISEEAYVDEYLLPLFGVGKASRIVEHMILSVEAYVICADNLRIDVFEVVGKRSLCL